MKTFPVLIRELRLKKGDPLRLVAAYLNIDQAILSKIERGKRKASRENVVKLAKYYHLDETELVRAWLSDKIADELGTENQAFEILKVAEGKVAYKIFPQSDRKFILKTIKQYFKQASGIQKVWIYGSFSRGDDGPMSDVDIAVVADADFSYFDLAGIQYHLEKLIKRKIDIGFMDSFKPYIFESISPDLKMVYER